MRAKKKPFKHVEPSKPWPRPSAVQEVRGTDEPKEKVREWDCHIPGPCYSCSNKDMCPKYIPSPPDTDGEVPERLKGIHAATTYLKALKEKTAEKMQMPPDTDGPEGMEKYIGLPCVFDHFRPGILNRIIYRDRTIPIYVDGVRRKFLVCEPYPSIEEYLKLKDANENLSSIVCENESLSISCAGLRNGYQDACDEIERLRGIEAATRAGVDEYRQEIRRLKCESLITLQHDISKWQRETFPGGTFEGQYTHLKKEIKELGVDRTAEEIADCLILILGLADKLSIDAHTSARLKLEVNKSRTWGEEDEHGVIEHIKE